MYKSYTTKCKNPTQTENAINREASQTEDREKRRSANKDTPAGRLHKRAVHVLKYPALTEANAALQEQFTLTLKTQKKKK